MNELTLKINQNPGSIELNFDEIEMQLDKRLEDYKGALFTEESKDIAKKETASLRKLKKDIDDARKAVKKEWMRPYEEFEVHMKRLMKKVDEPINLIDSQVKEFETKRKEEKRKKISEIYEEILRNDSEYKSYVPLERIYDTRWENAGTSLKAIKEDILTHLNQAKTAVDGILAMQSDKEQEALKLYKKTGDMSAAFSLIHTYEMNKAEALRREEVRRQAEQERQRQLEIERIRAEERKNVAREEQIRKEEREKALQEAAQASFADLETGEDSLPFEQPTTVTAFYKVVATPQELEQVEMAFNSIGIYFERRDK